jgi:hypothetical protein
MKRDEDRRGKRCLFVRPHSVHRRVERDAGLFLACRTTQVIGTPARGARERVHLLGAVADAKPDNNERLARYASQLTPLNHEAILGSSLSYRPRSWRVARNAATP